jgi:hypothetical protein
MTKPIKTSDQLNRLKYHLGNEDGFTLVGAMLIGLLLLFLIISFASYQYQTNKKIAAIGNRNNFGQLQNSIINSTGQTDAAAQSEALQVAPLATPAPTP